MRKMKILVIGANGQLGHDVIEEVKERGHICVGSDIEPAKNEQRNGKSSAVGEYISMDITDASQVHKVLEKIHPDAVIHCAAWTDVDGAEETENREKVFGINEGGTRNIALSCKEIGCKMLYISTDYVFGGEGREPLEPDCNKYNPLNIYGESKLAGEKIVSELLEKYFIVRTEWLYGVNGKNFVSTILNLAETHAEVHVVNDQIGTPTYSVDLARLLVDMIETERYGYYHATNEGGYISWCDFTKEIFTKVGIKTKVIPVTTLEYGASKAKRPLNSRLEKVKLSEMGFELLPDWKDALMRYLKEVKEK